MRNKIFTKEETIAIAVDLITEFATKHNMDVSSMSGIEKNTRLYITKCEESLIKSEFTRVLAEENSVS